MLLKSLGLAILSSAVVLTFSVDSASASTSAVEVGWEKVIDDGFSYHETDYRNVYNCQKISSACEGSAVETPGRCGPKKVRKEFYCAGPWRSYAGLWGTGNAYLFLSKYGANMPHISPKERKGWAVWQWEVKTSGIYRVEVFYRPTHNRTPDADYEVLSLKSLGEMDNRTSLLKKTIDQTLNGPLKSQGWVNFGNFEHKQGTVAAVGLWANDDTHSDGADAVRWTLLEKTSTTCPAANHAANLLLKRSR